MSEITTYETDDLYKLNMYVDAYKNYKIHNIALSTTFNSKENQIIYTVMIVFEK